MKTRSAFRSFKGTEEVRWTQIVGKLSEKYKYLLAIFCAALVAAWSRWRWWSFSWSAAEYQYGSDSRDGPGMVSVTWRCHGTELEDTMAYGDRVMGIIQENCPELDICI